MTERWSYAIAVPESMADELWDELYPEITIERGHAEMTFFSLYPTPQQYSDTPTVGQMPFFSRMSPEYGEIAVITFPNEDILVVYHNGRLNGVVAHPHPGTYDIIVPVKDGLDTIVGENLTAEEANALIAKLFEDAK